MEKTFEDKLKDLELIVNQLENGECGLDRSIELYSDGVKLAKELKDKLEDASRKIETVSVSEES